MNPSRHEHDLRELRGGDAVQIPTSSQRHLHRHGARHRPAGYHWQLPGVSGRQPQQEAAHCHQLLPGEEEPPA